MPINFFQAICQTSTSAPEFGICDDQPPANLPPYIDLVNRDRWIAIVDNNANHYNVTFTAIDKCIEIKDELGNDLTRCDCFLTYTENIVFVELKERDTKNKNWVPGGVEQLKSTINIFLDNHNIDDIPIRRAFLANNKKPEFQRSQIMTMQKFHDDIGFILLIQNRIKL
jgi:hypothetical protein